MNPRILELIGEQTSPLFRIMSVFNYNEPQRRIFDNNISAFHIGNGYVLSVAHALGMDAQIPRSVSDQEYQNEIYNQCTPDEKVVLDRSYNLDQNTNKRYLNITNNADIQIMVNIIKRIRYDARYITLYHKNICIPCLILNFYNDLFYNDPAVTSLIDPIKKFHEPNIGSYTYCLELELVHAFYSEDIALYRIINLDQSVIDKIPFARLDYNTHDIGNIVYCLQGSPSGTNLGRLFNEARIDGLLDQHDLFKDQFGNTTHVAKGLRYHLKGYFRFGSSGAPYFSYDVQADSFQVFAIQSQASPIQLSINHNREGNFQYINAIASPLSLIETQLRNYL